MSFAFLGAAVLVLRAGGEAVGWGFQLQEPAVVALFALLVFAIGLNLSGLFEVPGLARAKALARRGGLAGSFFTGVLAVAVAAPCTAPFMAAALGYGLSQRCSLRFWFLSRWESGFPRLSSPSVSPALLRLLPKPGGWMNVFRQLLAFPMYATGLWLLWVLSLESDPDQSRWCSRRRLYLRFALWVLGTAQHGRTSGGKGLAALAVVVAVAAFAAPATVLSPRASHRREFQASCIPGRPYSEAGLTALRAEQARRCLSTRRRRGASPALSTKRSRSTDPAVRAAFEKKQIAFLIADWTNRDPEVTALLQAHARSGVPLYLYYPPGASDAIVLPQILHAGSRASGDRPA